MVPPNVLNSTTPHPFQVTHLNNRDCGDPCTYRIAPRRSSGPERDRGTRSPGPVQTDYPIGLKQTVTSSRTQSTYTDPLEMSSLWAPTDTDGSPPVQDVQGSSRSPPPSWCHNPSGQRPTCHYRTTGEVGEPLSCGWDPTVTGQGVGQSARPREPNHTNLRHLNRGSKRRLEPLLTRVSYGLVPGRREPWTTRRPNPLNLHSAGVPESHTTNVHPRHVCRWTR